MRNLNYFDGFISDIRDLYCKTSSSKIENIFLRLSQVDLSNISSWLPKNKDIRSKLRNPQVYDALGLLIHLKKKDFRQG